MTVAAQRPAAQPVPQNPQNPQNPPRLHLVGHAHIDPAWLWQWSEGFSEVLATFRSALDRIAEHPDFVFSCGCAAFYEFVERVDPGMFREIAAAVERGRWEVVGGFWVEPDTNLSSGEALVRHALVSQRYFASRFGRLPSLAFNPDAFGHSNGLPQILAGAGFGAYVFMRPEPSEATLPRAFRWRSADGSSVVGYRIPVAYCTWPETLDRHLDAVGEALGGDGAADGLCFYGVGNHGGGPTRANLAALDARIARGEPLVYSRLHDYLGTVSARPSPLVEGELGYHARGAYSANSDMKAALRRTDAAVVRAEGAATMATVLTGTDYPAAALEEAWRALLCAGFHDVAAGTVIGSAAADALGALAGARATAERIAEEAHVSLAWNTAVRSAPDQLPLLVVNPHPWEATFPVEAEVGLGPGALELTDEDARRVPVQEIRSEAVTGGRRRVTFLVRAPACGSAVHLLRVRGPEVPVEPSPRAGGRWELEVDPATGGLRRLDHDGVPLLAGPSAHLTVSPDASDTWSHGLDAYRPSEDRFVGTGVEVLEDGPVRRVVRTTARHGWSSVRQTYLLHAGWDRVVVRVELDWHEQRAVGKLRFALPADAEVVAETPYSSLERPADGHEYPSGSWLAVTQRREGSEPAAASAPAWSLANDAKYAYDVVPGSLGLTVARSPVAAHHDPAEVDPSEDHAWLDQGRQCFTYVLAPCTSLLDAARSAAELIRPHGVVLGSHHPDARLPTGSGHLVVRGATVGALKRAEGGRATVLRLHNPDRRVVDAKVRFGRRWLRRKLRPTEIVSLRIPDDDREPVLETDLLETARETDLLEPARETDLLETVRDTDLLERP